MSGNDTTQALLATSGKAGLLFIKDEPGTGTWLSNFKNLHSVLGQKQIPVFVISNNVDAIAGYFADMPSVTLLKCDVVPIKTAARVNPTFFLLNNGTILDKWGYPDFDDAMETVNAQSN